MDDQAIVGFPGWSERVTFVNFLSYNNRKGIRFTNNAGTGSFARFHCIACYENIEQGQIGVSAEAGANVYDSTFDISGNIDDVPSSGGTLVSVDGTSVMEGDFNLRAESNVTIAHGGGTCISLASGASLFGRGAVDCSSSPGLISNSINSAAHFEIVGGHDPLQQIFSNSGVGPWLIPSTGNAQEGLGLNARWDQSNWICNGDGGHNGCALIAGNAVDGEIGFFSIASTGTTNKSVSNATMVAAKVATILPTGIAGLNIPIVTSFTTTAATTDPITVTGMTASGHCQLQATNAGAAGGTGTYVSNKTTNQITVTHTATSGWTFDVSCTPN